MESYWLAFMPGPIDTRKLEYERILEYENLDDETEKKFNARIPYFLNPYIKPNAGIYLSYFNVGIAMYILHAPIAYYLINSLGVSATQYSAYSTLIVVPWSLKFVFGMISDALPIFGYRRKSWMWVSWILFILIAMSLASTISPSFVQTTVLMFLLVCAYLVGDVCHDALCVERSRLEVDAIKGSFQTGAFSIRSFGAVVGAVLGSLLFNTAQWGWGLSIAQLCVLVGFIPLVTLLPSLWPLEELASRKPAPTVPEMAMDIWETFQLRAVWRPMVFIYSYYVMQVPNAAWTSFLVQGLGFSDFEIGALFIVTAVLFWVGILVFRRYFLDSSWRRIFQFTLLVNALFSLLQVALVMRWNEALGIPDLCFALGDNAVGHFIHAVSYMPTLIMFTKLCPVGSEAVTYAALAAMANLGGSVSHCIGTLLTLLFDVGNESLQAGDFRGVLGLTVATSVLQLSPLLFLHVLPDSPAEQKLLQESGERSVTGGVILLSTLALSLVGTILMNFMLVFV